MSGFICLRCCSSLRRVLRAQSRSINSSVRNSSPEPLRNKLVDIDALLSKPTWSVRSLLPDPDAPPSEEITPAKLHHLLRLSALPLPKSLDEEAEMLKTLHSQLHFVKDIQKVDTEGVEPLRSIRDETEEGVKEITIGMEDLKEAFEKEEIKGRNRRPRRRRGYMVDAQGVEDWDVLGTAGEKVELAGGKYFVVRSGKE
jgi:Asp-tRNA(Asn)/Glu-tRNA(Gln) amidotransferase C subunit